MSSPGIHSKTTIIAHKDNMYNKKEVEMGICQCLGCFSLGDKCILQRHQKAATSRKKKTYVALDEKALLTSV